MVKQNSDFLQAPQATGLVPIVNSLIDWEPEARRRVAVGLLFGEIIKKNGLEADQKEVLRTVEQLAKGYESPGDIISWYYSNPDQLKRVEHIVLEEAVVDLVLRHAKVSDETMSFDDLMNKPAPGR